MQSQTMSMVFEQADSKIFLT